MYPPNQDPREPPATIYSADGGPPLNAVALSENKRADIVVVGGGIAGLSLALHAAESGAKVIVLEAKTVGWGASSRNSGHVPPATKYTLDEMMRLYGPERGRRLIAATREGPELVFGLAEKHRMNAAVVRSGSIVAAHTPAALESLKRRVEALQELGYPAEILDRRRAAEAIGSAESYYCGCSLDRQGGTINPLAYVRGLARAAMAAGAEIHEGSPATSLTRDNGLWYITTPQGRVSAEFAALCTNAYTDDLWPGLKQTIVPVRAYQYVTRPLGENVRRTILPGLQGMTDTRRLMSGIRMLPDGRMLFSGRGPPFGPEGRPMTEISAQRIASIFPQIGPIQLEHGWTGWIAMNRERNWKIHELAPGLLSALGCNGRGVAVATTLGRELARYMRGAPAADLVLPFEPLRRIPAHAIHQPLVKALIAYYQVRDNLDMRRHRP